MSLTIYREKTEVITISESPALSWGRLCLFVQRTLGDGEWQKTNAAMTIRKQRSGGSTQFMHLFDAEPLAEALSVDVPELVRRAEAYWRERDEQLQRAVRMRAIVAGRAPEPTEPNLSDLDAGFVRELLGEDGDGDR